MCRQIANPVFIGIDILFDRQQRCFTNWEQNFHDYTFLLKEDWVSRAYEEKGHLVWNLFSPAFVSGASDQQKYVSVARAIPNVSAGADFLALKGQATMPMFAAGIEGLAEARTLVEGGVYRLGISSRALVSEHVRENAAAFSRLLGRSL